MLELIATASLPQALGAAFGAATVGALLRLHARWRPLLAEDPPDGRKRHGRPLPMAGVALGGLAALALATLASAEAAGGVGLATGIGVLDDRRKSTGRGLPVGVKTAGLLAAAFLLADASGATRLSAGAGVLACLFAFVVMNALNFLDSAHGVSATVGGLGLLLATGGQGPGALAGWLYLGFLPWNWPRPRALLGDAGALSLGACLALVALEQAWHASAPSWAAALAPVAVPLADFVQVVCARVWLGFAPWIADRRHVTHIVMNAGLPQALVAPLLAGATVALFVALA